MKRTKKHYDRSFKEHAVKLTYERENISATARELGVDYRILRRWRKEYEEFKDASFQGKGVARLTVEQVENQRLKNDNSRLKMENEILKKALGIISVSDRKNTSL